MEPTSASAELNRDQPSLSSRPRLGLCLSFFVRFLFSARFTGGGVPKTARDAAFTMPAALIFFGFFFFGMSY